MRRKSLSFAAKRRLLGPYWNGLKGKLTAPKKAWINKVYNQYKLVQNIQTKKDRHYKFVPGLKLKGKTRLKTNKGSWVLLTNETDKIKVIKNNYTYVVQHTRKAKGEAGRVDVYMPVDAVKMVKSPKKFAEKLRGEFGENISVHLMINGYLTSVHYNLDKYEEFFSTSGAVSGEEGESGIKKLYKTNKEALNATVEYVRVTMTKGQYDSYIRREKSSERARDSRGRFTKTPKRKARKKQK